MADIIEIIRKGETRPLFGSATAPSGTLTITGSPAYVLYNADGSTATSGSCTGYDNTALATVRAWINLPTSSISAGTYNLAISFSATSSVDSMTRAYESSLGISLISVAT